MHKTFKISIQGQVQGVGFRPFVFSLAEKHGVKGEVFNNEDGVVIIFNASRMAANAFLDNLIKHRPKISRILSHRMVPISTREFSDFTIVPSRKKGQINIPLTPDFAVCDDCKQEIEDPENRRFQYAFTTCVKCGPRYAITDKYPFERANTAMADFKMCSFCQAEYADPTDRRFHSQTNSCPQCGIRLRLVSANGKTMATDQDKILVKTVQLIFNGNIVAIKNTNGYLLCCDAKNEGAVATLRQRKRRPLKPFAVLYPSLSKVEEDFAIGPIEKETLLSPEAPIVILPISKSENDLSIDAIAPNLKHLGVMLPSSALLHLIMTKMGSPIVATSGNIHGSPIISQNREAEKSLQKVADYFLHHNLKIRFPQDDSVVKFNGEEPVILRRSRGWAPNYSGAINTSKKTILAMGAHLKSTFAFVPNSNIYVSQYFGNLDNYEVAERYRATLKNYMVLFETNPEVILIDSHPQYQSSIMGRELAAEGNSEIVMIPHHKAHFASVMAEHELFASEALPAKGSEKVLGVVWDGTGLGEDGAIWGGEFFVYENNTMERLTYFEYFDWIAADKMAKEPRLALLSLSSKENRTAIKPKFSETEWKVYTKLLKKNTLKTSSVGRLFDAVASVLDITDFNSFEGDAAMRLEAIAMEYTEKNYIDFLGGVEYEIIPPKKILESIQKSLSEGIPEQRIAASFIHTLAKIIVQVAQKNKISCIACSGGVFQNTILLESLRLLTENKEITLKINRKLSSNDENIALGQIFYYLKIHALSVDNP